MRGFYFIFLFCSIHYLCHSDEGKKAKAPKRGRYINRDGFGGRHVDLSEFKIVGVPYKTMKRKKRYKAQQYCQNTPIFGAMIVVEQDEDESNSIAIRGLFYECSDIELDVTSYNFIQNEAIKLVIAPESTIKSQTATLYIYFDPNDKKEIIKQYLSWIIHVSGQNGDELYSWLAIVDANSGEILLKIDTVEQLLVNEIGGNERIGQINHEFNLPSYPNLENDFVKVINNNNNNIIQCTSTSDCISDEVNGAYGPAGDAFQFGNDVVNLYKEWLAQPLTPINPSQMPLRLKIYLNEENAYWNGYGLLLGNGGSSYYPLVGLDVVGHEAAHGFTEWQSGLIYSGESGGMNEAYSDLVGVVAEEYAYGYTSWMVGDTISKLSYRSALRYLYDPPIDGISVDKWSRSSKTLNVHLSSGIYNKAYYLLYSYGLSTKEIFQIATKANEIYWTPDVTMSDGVCGMIDAAIDLFDEKPSYIYDIREAFKTVNLVCDGDVQIVLQKDGLSATKGQQLHFEYNNTNEQILKISIDDHLYIGDADLYIKFGQVPTKSSYDCRPYLASNREACTFSSPQIGTYYIMINAYAAFTGVSLVIEGPDISGNGFNQIDQCQASPSIEIINWSIGNSNWLVDDINGIWTSDEADCGYVDTVYMTYDEAEHYCINVCDSHLMTISNNIEMENAKLLIKNSNKKHVIPWIGLVNIKKLGLPQWFEFLDGTKCPNSYSGACVKFWIDEGFPKCVDKGGHDCTVLYDNIDKIGNDKPCKSKRPFLCGDSDKMNWRKITFEFAEMFVNESYACNYDDFITVTTKARGGSSNYNAGYRFSVLFESILGSEIIASYDSNLTNLTSIDEEFSITYDNKLGLSTQVTIIEYAQYGAILSIPVINIPISCSFVPLDHTDSNLWNIVTNGGDGWLITHNIDKLWISSYDECIRTITIDLSKYCSLQTQYLTVTGRASGTAPNYNDIYRLVVEFKNNIDVIIYTFDTGYINTNSFYKQYIASYDNSNGLVTKITITEYGNDIENNNTGHHGTSLKLPIIRISDRDDTPYTSNTARRRLLSVQNHHSSYYNHNNNHIMFALFLYLIAILLCHVIYCGIKIKKNGLENEKISI